MSGSTTIEVDGYTFEVTFGRDDATGSPWNREDGHGDVRISGKPHWYGEGVSDKLPGERPMNKPNSHGYQYYYDWAGACKKARKDVWGPGGIHEAVQADFKYLQGWVDKEWEYVCVEVTLENRTEYTRCVCGVETHKDYHLEFAEELAREVIEEYLDDMEKNELKGFDPATGANAPEGERR